MPNTESSGSGFRVDAEKCVACGACVKDCLAGIIELDGSVAAIRAENDDECVRCQHCLAVCPTGAVSVAGAVPEMSLPAAGLSPEALERFIRSRRSVRQFAPQGVPPDEIRRILDVVACAPTGVNMRHRRFAVILEPAVMDDFRARTAKTLVEKEKSLPPDTVWLVELARLWLDSGVDVICRGAPHLLVVTAGPNQVCKVPDCLIALSYFDLYAQACGIGTTWAGMVEGVLRQCPESREWLGIPPDHEIGYAMLFGRAGVAYSRTVNHAAEDVAILSTLK